MTVRDLSQPLITEAQTKPYKFDKGLLKWKMLGAPDSCKLPTRPPALSLRGHLQTAQKVPSNIVLLEAGSRGKGSAHRLWMSRLSPRRGLPAQPSVTPPPTLREVTVFDPMLPLTRLKNTSPQALYLFLVTFTNTLRAGILGDLT